MEGPIIVKWSIFKNKRLNCFNWTHHSRIGTAHTSIQNDFKDALTYAVNYCTLQFPVRDGKSRTEHNDMIELTSIWIQPMYFETHI